MLMSLCKLKKKTNLLTTFDLPLHEIVIEPSSFSSDFQDFFFIFKIFKAWPTDKQDISRILFPAIFHCLVTANMKLCVLVLGILKVLKIHSSKPHK